MAIADRVEKAFIDLQGRDLENALIQISVAVDATAKRMRPKSGVGERCRKFIQSNEDFIYHFAMDGRLKLADGARLKFGQAGDLGHILYKSVRCALLHEGDISSTVEFVSNLSLGHKGGKFLINEGMIFGLLFAIVAAPVNIRERTKSDLRIEYKGQPLNINELWGRPDLINTLVSYKKFPDLTP